MGKSGGVKVSREKGKSTLFLEREKCFPTFRVYTSVTLNSCGEEREGG